MFCLKILIFYMFFIIIIYFNVKKKYFFYKRFLNEFVKNGKLTSTKQIVDNTFISVSKKLNLPPHLVFVKFFLRLNCSVESRSIQLGRKIHHVPFSITSKRRLHLIARWVHEIIAKDFRKISLSEKLFFELLEILTLKHSKTRNKRKMNLDQASLNRANSHFRW